jgi:glycine/D-amino acid oxidase-like deaminating enzyme
LSAAIAIKEFLPHLSVKVFERGILPTGASTRNAGFACIGSAGEIWKDLQNEPLEQVLSLIEMRVRGLEKLRKRLGDSNIFYRENGSFELLQAKDDHILDKVSSLNELLQNITRKKTFSIEDNSLIRHFGFNTHTFKGIIRNHLEGELHTGEMMRQLYLLAIQKGVEVIAGCPITRIEDNENTVNITVSDHYRKDEYTFTALKLIAATNAFTCELFPQEEAIPGRGTVLIVQSEQPLKFAGIFHFDEGYYYFREIDGYVLLGGGRNEDISGETTTSFDINPIVYQSLIKKLDNDILPHQRYKVLMKWSGIMAFGKNKSPTLKWLSKNIFGAFKMGGMGVAIGSVAGDIAAKNVVDSLES